MDLNKLMVQMMWSGQGYKSREIVAKRILAKHNSTMRNYWDLGRPIYRSREERLAIPRKDMTDWFRDDGTTAIMMVPTTTGSKLVRELRDTILKHPGPKGTKVRIVEKPGIPIMRGLMNNNPFKLQQCGRMK